MVEVALTLCNWPFPHVCSPPPPLAKRLVVVLTSIEAAVQTASPDAAAASPFGFAELADAVAADEVLSEQEEELISVTSIANETCATLLALVVPEVAIVVAKPTPEVAFGAEAAIKSREKQFEKVLFGPRNSLSDKES